MARNTTMGAKRGSTIRQGITAKATVTDFTTAIAVKNGANSGRKSDAAFIMTKDKKRWEEVTNVFKQIISANMATADFK